MAIATVLAQKRKFEPGALHRHHHGGGRAPGPRLNRARRGRGWGGAGRPMAGRGGAPRHRTRSTAGLVTLGAVQWAVGRPRTGRPRPSCPSPCGMLDQFPLRRLIRPAAERARAGHGTLPTVIRQGFACHSQTTCQIAEQDTSGRPAADRGAPPSTVSTVAPLVPAAPQSNSPPADSRPIQICPQVAATRSAGDPNGSPASTVTRTTDTHGCSTISIRRITLLTCQAARAVPSRRGSRLPAAPRAGGFANENLDRHTRRCVTNSRRIAAAAARAGHSIGVGACTRFPHISALAALGLRPGADRRRYCRLVPTQRGRRADPLGLGWREQPRSDAGDNRQFPPEPSRYSRPGGHRLGSRGKGDRAHRQLAAFSWKVEAPGHPPRS